jgi:hypothetical protein
MNSRIAIFAAAAIMLALIPAARAQSAAPGETHLEWVDSTTTRQADSVGPTSPDAVTKRLEDEAARMASEDKRNDGPGGPPTSHPHTVSFDYVYPVSGAEYRALGANGVVLVSAVVKNPKELPIKRVVLRFGGKDVALQSIATRQSTVPSSSPLAKTVGANRVDAFYLLPGKAPGKEADLWVYFSPPGEAVRAGRVAVIDLPEDLKALPSTQPDEAALKKVLAREYPNLVKP